MSVVGFHRRCVLEVHEVSLTDVCFYFVPSLLTLAPLYLRAALGTGVGLGVVSAGRVVTGCRGLIEGGHMVRDKRATKVLRVPDKGVCLSV